MSNERRIYKNYYLTDREYVDISLAKADKNIEKLTMTDEIACWPKKPYDGGKALEILTRLCGERCAITVPLFGKDYSDKDALSIAVNGATACDMIRIEVVSKSGEKSVDEINFFNDRWSRLLVKTSDNPALKNADKLNIEFYSVKGLNVSDESIYIGEIYFGNLLDFRFEQGNAFKYFLCKGVLRQGDGYLEYSFNKREPLVFPHFKKARYSVLNAVISVKDSLRITAENLGDCKDFRLYIATDLCPDFSVDKYVDFRLEDKLSTVIVPIKQFAVDDNERLEGIKIEPLSECGTVRFYNIAPSQENDIIGDELGSAYLKRALKKVANPYKIRIRGKSYDVYDFGAKGDGYTDDTKAIQRAIDEAALNGGGKVVLSRGEFVATHIVMKSCVELNIGKGATIVQSEVPAHYNYDVAYEHDNFYYSIQWAHNFLVHNKPLIYGNGISEFKVAGEGRIRMCDSGSERLCGGWPYYDIHCNALIHIVPITFNKCSDFEVSGITITRANSYHVFLVHCKNVFLNGLKFIDPRCLSADGIGLNGSKNCLIANTVMVTNDDGITLNPGYIDPRGYDGNFWDCTPGADNSIENIEIRDCYINSAYGGWGKAIAFIPWGKSAENQENEMTKNVFVHDCILKGGHAVGTWCDDPYHGKQPFDGSETDDYSPISDIVFKNNVYLSPCDLLTVKVTNLVSDNNLKSSFEIVNGNFQDRSCNWTIDGEVSFSASPTCAIVKNGGEIKQTISSVIGLNAFEISVEGKGEVSLGGVKVAFDCAQRESVFIRKKYSAVKNITLSIKAQSAKIYSVKRDK